MKKQIVLSLSDIICVRLTCKKCNVAAELPLDKISSAICPICTKPLKFQGSLTANDPQSMVYPTSMLVAFAEAIKAMQANADASVELIVHDNSVTQN